MILGRPWIKKHGVIIEMTNNFFIFWPGHCTYIGATSATTLSQLRQPIIIVAIRIKKDITPQKMFIKGLIEDITDFLQTFNKLSHKKKS